MMAEANSVLLLHNPRSGARHAREIIDAHLEQLRRAGFECTAHDSLEMFERDAARLFSEAKLRAVVSAGGDGTASAVASRVDASSRFGYVPWGPKICWLVISTCVPIRY